MKDRSPAGASGYAEVIRSTRREKGINQQQLADRIGVSRNTVAGWETGHSRPDLASLPALCEALGITINTFFNVNDDNDIVERRALELFRSLEEGDRQVILWQMDALRTQRAIQRNRTVQAGLLSAGTAAPDKTISSGNSFEAHSSFKSSFVRPDMDIASRRQAAVFGSGPEEAETLRRRVIRLYRSDLSAAAGSGVTMEEERGEQVWILSDEQTVRADEIITVNGSSMEPTFRDGDQVLVQHTESLREGEIGIFISEGEGYIKEYRKDGLYSHNRHFAPMRFDENSDVRCVGRVLGKVEDSQWPTEAQLEMLEEMRL